jgi:type I restriction enzyme S subunit
LGAVVEPKKGKTITRKTAIEGDIPVVAGGLEPAYYHNVHNVEAPVVTISASGANAGFVRLYNKNIWASDCSFISKTQTNHIYCIYTLLKFSQKEIYGMQQGAAQPHIYPSDIMRLIVTIPKEEIWNKLETILLGIYCKIAENEKQSQTLTQIRDSLLPKLLSGEIDVSNLNIAEGE